MPKKLLIISLTSRLETKFWTFLDRLLVPTSVDSLEGRAAHSPSAAVCGGVLRPVAVLPDLVVVQEGAAGRGALGHNSMGVRVSHQLFL